MIWACALGGFPTLTVAVAPQLLPTNAVAAKLVAAVAMLQARHVIASDEIVAPLRALLPATVVTAMTALDKAAPVSIDSAMQPLPRVLPPIASEDVLFFQLTSGSTGVPQVIPETHRAVIAHIRQTAQRHGALPHTETSLNWLPLDHVVPMLTLHLADVYLPSCVQLPTDEVISDPLLWLRTMAEHNVTHSWAPNFGFKLVVAALRGAGGDHCVSW